MKSSNGGSWKRNGKAPGMSLAHVVITGVGVVSPIGIGRDAFWESLCRGRSGVRRVALLDAWGMPVRIAGIVENFKAAQYLPQRKALKVMARDAQLGAAASVLACRDAGIAPGRVDPQRFGVVLAADTICSPIEESDAIYRPCMVGPRFDFGRWGTAGLAGSYPLNFLRVLPNMIASHISIIHDARGPNNTIHQNEASSLLAIGEAAAVIERGAADVMLAGGASSQMTPFDCVRRSAMGLLSPRQDDPAAVMRPFDAGRDGQVWGEGAAVFVLESRRAAEARGATILGQVLSWASACHCRRGAGSDPGAALRRAMQLALERAELNGRPLGHVNAQGLSTVRDDPLRRRRFATPRPTFPSRRRGVSSAIWGRRAGRSKRRPACCRFAPA